MRRFLALTLLAAFLVALPTAHLMASPSRKIPVCVTGKNQKSGVVATIPEPVAKDLAQKGIMCVSFFQQKNSNACDCAGGDGKK